MDKNILNLNTVINTVLSETNKYISCFDSFSDFSFRKSAKDIENEYKFYRGFSVKLTNFLLDADAYANNIALLICKADLNRDSDSVGILSNIFDSYSAWKSSLTDFLDRNDSLFDSENQDTYKSSKAVSYARTFLNETISLKGKLNNEALSSLS